MKLFVIVLVMLAAFSMEKKLRLKSKAKAIMTWYINTPIYLESFHGYSLNIVETYKIEIIAGKDLTWKIQYLKNDNIYVVASNGSYLCTKTIYNTPHACRKATVDAEWELYTLGSKKVAFRTLNGKYLRATKVGLITSVITYHLLTDWESWTPVKP